MIVPEIDYPIINNIKDKKIVIYTANKVGEFPHNFTKSFIPSSIPIKLDWYVGYTNIMLDDFNMIEIPLDIARGLQSFNIINHSKKRYDQYNRPNPNNEKKEIIMTEDEIYLQVKAKKFLIEKEIIRIFNKKIDSLYNQYGRESDSWEIQYSEAIEYKNGNNDTPFIDILSSKRNISKELLIEKIIAKNKEFKQKFAKIIAEKHTLEDKLKNMNTDTLLNLFIDENIVK